MSQQRFSEVAAIIDELVPCTTAELWTAAEELLVETKRLIGEVVRLENQVNAPQHTTS